MTEETCKECRYFHLMETNGICRRETPYMDEFGIGKWPIVNMSDWCGEFSPDYENFMYRINESIKSRQNSSD